MSVAIQPPSSLEWDEYGLPLYPPGIVVPPGRYVRDDRPWAPPLVLEQADRLPASLDGRRARYARLPDPTA
jgi:hypothetical protein